MLEAVHLSPYAIGTDVKDGHEIKLENIEPSLNVLPATITKTIIMVIAPREIPMFEISFFISLLNHFVYWHSVIMTSAQNWLKTTISSWHVPFNPLSPNFIQIEILQTDLHTFPSRIGSENLFVDQSTAHQVIILFILTAVSLDYVLTLLRENWLWSLLGLKE